MAVTNDGPELNGAVVVGEAVVQFLSDGTRRIKGHEYRLDDKIHGNEDSTQIKSLTESNRGVQSADDGEKLPKKITKEDLRKLGQVIKMEPDYKYTLDLFKLSSSLWRVISVIQVVLFNYAELTKEVNQKDLSEKTVKELIAVSYREAINLVSGFYGTSPESVRSSLNVYYKQNEMTSVKMQEILMRYIKTGDIKNLVNFFDKAIAKSSYGDSVVDKNGIDAFFKNPKKCRLMLGGRTLIAVRNR